MHEIARLHIESAVARICFHDPESNNALNPTTIEALRASVRLALAGDNVRALVLEHEGGSFCRGMDLRKVAEMSGDGAAPPSAAAPANTGEIGDGYSMLLQEIKQAPVPTIACINGEVRAGGVGLVAAFDWVIATEASDAGLTEAIFGLVPYNVIPVLRGRVSEAVIRRWILSAETIDGSAAQQAGLFDERVADGPALEKRLRGALKQILRAKPSALADAKAFLDRTAPLPIHEQAAHARAALAEWLAEPENHAPIRRYLADGEALPWFAKYRPAK